MTKIKNLFGVLAIFALTPLLLYCSSGSGDPGSSVNLSKELDAQVVARAEPDECFCGVGDPANGPIMEGEDCSTRISFTPANETSCTDGGDNDGNGVIDCADRACDNIIGPAGVECETSRRGANERTCDDGIDNDGDGLADTADPDCGTPTAVQVAGGETGALCADHLDNDGDGFVDCADTECKTGPTGVTCEPEGEVSCADGGDNDGDGRVDCADSDCAGVGTCQSEEICDDGQDNDGDGLIDSADPDCEGGEVPAQVGVETDCGDGVDNDGDFRIDCADVDCAGHTGPRGIMCDINMCKPKIDQSYIWGMTEIDNVLWFGTFANATCLVSGSNALATGSSGFGGGGGGGGGDNVCEFGMSQFPRPSPPYQSPFPDQFGDHRPPRIYSYDTQSEKLEEKFVDNCVSLTDSFTAKDLLDTTLGIRSAGSVVDKEGNKIIFFAGPAIVPGVNMFAFNGDTGECIAAKNFPEWNNIRQWLDVDGVLYTAVGGSEGGGSVLRWVGDFSALPESVMQFDVVGNLDGTGAYMAFHDGRIFVSTWPNFILGDVIETPNPPGLFMSPPVPPEGLSSADAGEWIKVWQVDQYEPDPLLALTYGGGPVTSFDGWLYWGTIHVPNIGRTVHLRFREPDLQCGGGFGGGGSQCAPDDVDCQRCADASMNTDRATSIFRGRNFGGPEQEVDLLYGEDSLPAFDTSGWELVQNNMHQSPLFGQSGFDNPGNLYLWSALVWNGDLYDGTLELGFGGGGGQDSDNPNGADLWRFSSLSSPAEPVFLDGASNPENSGFRTMASADCLYLGSANNNNLSPQGGWELIKLVPMSEELRQETGCF
jgi:hypothetical protein